MAVDFLITCNINAFLQYNNFSFFQSFYYPIPDLNDILCFCITVGHQNEGFGGKMNLRIPDIKVHYRGNLKKGF